MPTKKTTEKQSPARPKPGADGKGTVNTRSRQFWVGVGWIGLGVVLLAYLAYGAALYFTDITGGFAEFWTTIFYYPAANVLTSGYLGWFLLSLLIPVLILLSLAKLIYYKVKGKQMSREHLIGLVVFLAVLGIAHFFVPSPANAAASYGEYLDRFAALNTFQEKRKQLQPGGQDVAADEVKATALQQLVLADIIRQEATKFDVKVSQKEVDEFYKDQAERNQGEGNLKKQLKDFLGWSPEDFKREIKLRLLQEKLNTKLATDEDVNKDAKKKADEFLKRVKAGEDFATVAKESDDPTAQAGGDQGVVKRGEADPKIEEVAFKLNPGEVSDVIKTDRGFVIIKVTEKPAADQVKISQISVRTKTLNEFIPEELKNAKVSIYVKGLLWDKNLYAVQPKNRAGQVPGQGQTPPAAASPAAAPATPAAPPAQ